MDFEERRNFFIPHPIQILLESRGVIEATQLLIQLFPLLQHPRGSGHILFLPGFATDDSITYPFRAYLDSLGYSTSGWGLGMNHGNVPKLLPKVYKLVRSTYKDKRKKIILIGWSLGGYLAREAARNYPEMIHMVITLGSPVVGGPKYTSVRNIFEWNGTNIDRLEDEIDSRFEVPIEVPVFAFYSKQDNIVSWQACIDYYSPKIRHIVLQTSHIGFLYSPDSYSNVALALSGKIQI